MNSQDDLIEILRQLSVSEREAYLQKTVVDETERKRLGAKLVEMDEADAFMGDHLDNKHGILGANEPEESGFAEREGDQVGPYTLRQKIGEGGFGVVWMAEQNEPISRMVALKVVKAGMDTEQVLARFEAERQALALMDHSNIARVLDAGATPTGRPFFAMELVKGIPITEFCREQKLNMRERLALFQDVCSAVNHAHQKGVIHRDLKPSNVMVTLEADKPIAKVIDFGIAKATQNKLTEKTLFTRFEQFLGTPVYMSPEQAAMSNLDVDTRSDIYSLGVLLYELLAGQPPFDSETLLSAGYDEMRRIIKEDEPPKPSTRLTQTQDSSSRTYPHITPKVLRGELDWIVMKAIEKDRSRRYETANAFAADISRYLTDQPVQAAAPSAAYKLRKFARRNKVALTVGAMLATVMLVATTISVWQAREATAAREDAEAISDFLTNMFESVRPGEENGGRDVTVAEILDQATEKLRKDQNYPPERRAKLLRVLGQTYHQLSRFDDALSLLTTALDTFLEIHGETHRDTLKTMMALAETFVVFGDHIEALALSRKALDLCRYAYDRDDSLTLELMGTRLWIGLQTSKRGGEFAALGDELVTLSREVHGERSSQHIAAMHSWAHVCELEKSHTLHQKVVEISRESLGLTDKETLRAMKCLGISFAERGQAGEAVKMQREAYHKMENLKGREHPLTIGIMTRLAGAYASNNQLKDAIALGEEELALSEEIFGEESTQTLNSKNNLAIRYEADDRQEKALAMRREVLSVSKRIHPESALTLTAMNNLASSLSNTGRLDEAIELLQEVVKRQEDKFGLDQAGTLVFKNNLAKAYDEAGKKEQALEIRRQVYDASKEQLGPKNPNTLKMMNNLAHSLVQVPGREREAIELCEEVLAIDQDDDTSMNNLGMAYCKIGEFERGYKLLEDSLAGLRNAYGIRHSRTRKMMRSLANTYLDNGLAEKAIGYHRELLDYHRETNGPEDQGTLAALKELRKSLLAADRRGESVKCLNETLREVLARDEVDDTENSGYLGIDMAPGMVQVRGESLPSIRVGEVMWDSPAAHAGLKSGDHIIEVDDLVFEPPKIHPLTLRPASLTNVKKVGNHIADLGAGAILNLKIRRWLPDGKYESMDQSVRLGSQSQTDRATRELMALYEKEGLLGEALTIYQDTKRFGPEHRTTLRVMHHQSVFLARQGHKEAALDMRQKVFTLMKDLLGEEDRDTLGAMTNLANSLRDVELQKKSFEIKLRVLPPDDPWTINAFRNLNRRYVQNGQLDKAVQLTRDILDFSRKTNGTNHVITGNLAAELGFALDQHPSEKKDHEEIIAAWQEAVRISSWNANVQYWLGRKLMNENRFKEAMVTLQVARGLYPIGHPRGHEVRELLINAFTKLGREDDAAKLRWKLDQPPTTLDDATAPLVKLELVPPNSEWHWLHPTDGSDPAASDPDFHTTFFTAGYDDTSWRTGQDSEGPTGGFGYGNPAGIDIGSPISNELGKGAYFRHPFKTEQTHTNLELRCQRDDGIIIYLDGVEMARDNMSTGEEAYGLSAASVVGTFETTIYRIPLQGPLPPGDHILAISLHNAHGPAEPSSDLSIGRITLVEVEER